MNVGQICQRNAVTVRSADELRTAAKLMREHHIGFLVVVQPAGSRDDTGGSRDDPAASRDNLEAIGVITDRDIVVSTLALDVDPATVTVGDVMTSKPATALAEDSVADAIQQMRHRGVRRLPVVADYGRLVGVISLDDILRASADEIGAAAGAIAKGRELESRTRGRG